MNRAKSAGYRPYPSFLRKRESRSGKFFRFAPWTPALERVRELAARPVTSPRLRGEVGICASARGFRGGATALFCNGELLYNREEAPHPNPLPARGARENRAPDPANA